MTDGNKDDDNVKLLNILSEIPENSFKNSSVNYKFIILFFGVIIATLATFLFFRYLTYKLSDKQAISKHNNPLLLINNAKYKTYNREGLYNVYDISEDVYKLQDTQVRSEIELKECLKKNPNDDILLREELAEKKLNYLKSKLKVEK